MNDDSRSARLKRRTSRVLQRAPWLLSILIGLVRWTRARYTAGVVGVVRNEHHEILIVEHLFHAPERWGLPGGWMDRNEAPRAALQRELQEELGLEIRVLQPVHVASGDRPGHLDIAFLCHAESDVQHLSGELMDYRWAPPDNLPPLPTFHRVAVEAACTQRVSEDGNTL